MRQQRIAVRRSTPALKGRLLSALLAYLPGAWINPRNEELVALYRLRSRMAMEEKKFDTAMIFLNKILEVDPMNLEAKLHKGEIYHRCLNDYGRAIEHYNKVLRIATGRDDEPIHRRAQANMAEIMELLS